MRTLRKLAAMAAIVSLVSGATVGVAAQSASPAAGQASAQPAAANDTMAAGLLDGEMLAEGHGTGGKLGTGLAIGVLTGVIGTGIGYFVVGPAPLSAEALQRSAGKSPDYQLGLKTGWEKKTKSRKRNAFLAGGLLGTAAFVVLVASAQGAQ